MNGMFETMLSRHDAATIGERKQALRGVTQEIILCGLSRAGFFGPAAFYGAAALRIFHGLDRFSEDMGFSLRKSDPGFDLSRYLASAQRECEAWGLHFTAEGRAKSGRSAIRPAFPKGNTRGHVITLFSDDGVADAIAPGELLRIKIEVDTDPAPCATYERRYRLLPAPYEVGLYDMPSLFAGKAHAVVARAWKSRTKGRDLYDYVFYRSRNAPVSLARLREKLVQSGRLVPGAAFTTDDARAMLCKRFAAIDYRRAKADVLPFVADARALDVWSYEFFAAITQGLADV